MIVPGSTNPLLMRSAAPAAYQISRSLRFNSADSAQLSKTFSTAGDRRTWTLSWWMKLGKLGTARGLFGMPGTSSGAPQFWSIIDNDDQIYIYDYVSSSTYQFVKKSAVKLRDASAWYHCMFVYDSTQSVAEDGFKIYLNGTRLTTWTTNTLTGYVQNYQGAWNSTQNTGVHIIGQSDNYFDGYMADIWFVGGSALTPSDFAETNATTGQWVPKAYTGSTSGTNTFHLDFADNSGTTSTTLGKDTSGNSNNFTPSGFSVTAGSGNDSLTDTPTSYGTDTGTGGEVVGNYCTLSPLANGGLTLSNGNLDFTSDSANRDTALGTIAVSSGKWYWEMTVTANAIGVGIEKASYYPAADKRTGIDTNGYAWWIDRQQTYFNGSATAYGASVTTGDVIGVALDLDAGTLVFYKNGSSQGTAYSSISGSYVPSVADISNVASATGVLNFGQRAFAYPVSGFKALVDTNLTAPTITKPSTVFDVVTYTGTGSALTPTSSLGFSPDLIWIKSRSAATDNTLYDTVRGAEKRLESNNTDAEVTSDGGVTAFNSNGFTLGTLAQVNTNAATYVGWCWDGGTSTVTNTNGTITSSVRANASAGISIVGYTGTGTAGTVGHGLGVTPGMVIVKSRGTPGTSDAWATYMTGASATAGAYLLLEKTAAVGTSSVVFNGTNPTSSVFSIGNWAGINSNGLTYIAYAFAPVSGFSSFGSYTGNGSADGPFVYTGHRSRWVMIKRTDAAGDWIIWDALRPGYNASQLNLYPNLSNAENAAGYNIDIVSNGFKLRDAGGTSFNTSNGTYVWAAFAESPFLYARAR